MLMDPILSRLASLCYKKSFPGLWRRCRTVVERMLPRDQEVVGLNPGSPVQFLS